MAFEEERFEWAPVRRESWRAAAASRQSRRADHLYAVRHFRRRALLASETLDTSSTSGQVEDAETQSQISSEFHKNFGFVTHAGCLSSSVRTSLTVGNV